MEEVKTTKVCRICKRELTLDNFHKKVSAKDGLQCECIDCRRDLLKKSRNTNKSNKIYFNPDLAKFQPRELICELRARGYSGTLSYTQTINV